MLIYKITNLANNKSYIGKTIASLEKRWKMHNYKHSGCLAIKNAIQKYGKDKFIIEQIDQADNIEELNKKEKMWIEKLNTISPKGYNLTEGGDGVVPSKEIRQKMSHAKLGKKLSESTKQKMKGRIPWNKGKLLSEESKKKMSDSKKGIVTWNKGRSQSEIHKLNAAKARSKPVLCVELNKVFISIRECAKYLNIDEGHISSACSGNRKTVGGYTFIRLEKKHA